MLFGVGAAMGSGRSASGVLGEGTLYSLLAQNMMGGFLRRVTLEAAKHGKGSWMKKVASCCKEFRW